MPSFGIPSGHKPVRWQYQIFESWRKIGEAYQVKSRKVPKRRRPLGSRCFATCALYTCQLDEPQPFQDEEDVVKIEWPSQPRLLGNNMSFHTHDIDDSELECSLSGTLMPTEDMKFCNSTRCWLVFALVQGIVGGWMLAWMGRRPAGGGWGLGTTTTST